MNTDRPSTPAASGPVVLRGIAGSPGLAIGKAFVIDTRRTGVTRRHIRKHQADEEFSRFLAAVEEAQRGIREVVDGAVRQLAKAEASILQAYLLMLEDEALRDEVERHIRIDLQSAEWAVDVATSEMASQLRQNSDPYLSERSHDLEFIGDVIQRALGGRSRSVGLPPITDPVIVVAQDLSPAETAALPKDRVLAIATEIGTRTSHTAILARALEIPAVVGVTGLLAHVGNDDALIVDGHRGVVTRSPTEEVLTAASARAERYLALARDRHAARDRPCTTRCGVAIEIQANIELPEEAKIALYEGARGIGLYRTEFIYVDRTDVPSEDEQYEVYRKVVETVAPLPVTIRTFDIGGDKFVSAFQAPPQMNPALGLRAVRLALSRPELFLDQLRAIVRASAHGVLRVMIPMISGLQEFNQVRQLLDRAVEQVDATGHAHADNIPLGAMIEVPSAAIMSRELAASAEFLSIGTNDLVQYTLAMDRTSRELAKLATPFDPAILRLIHLVIQAADEKKRGVSVCGAMASDPLAAMVLIGMGLRELSMEASAVPEVREAISRVSLHETEELANRALFLSTAHDVEKAVNEAFADRFADLLETD